MTKSMYEVDGKLQRYAMPHDKEKKCSFLLQNEDLS